MGRVTPAWHWCWLSRTKRVKRLGAATACLECNRYKSKHRCGARSDWPTSMLPYPVEECGSCNPALPPGEFSMGAAPIVQELVPPENARLPDPPKRREGPPAKVLRKRAENRRELILVAIALGKRRKSEIQRTVESFGVSVHRSTIGADLDRLVEDHWLVKTKVERHNAPSWQSPHEWAYSLNPAVTERIHNEARTSG